MSNINLYEGINTNTHICIINVSTFMYIYESPWGGYFAYKTALTVNELLVGP